MTINFSATLTIMWKKTIRIDVNYFANNNKNKRQFETFNFSLNEELLSNDKYYSFREKINSKSLLLSQIDKPSIIGFYNNKQISFKEWWYKNKLHSYYGPALEIFNEDSDTIFTEYYYFGEPLPVYLWAKNCYDDGYMTHEKYLEITLLHYE